jgi:hypothetical protein
VITSASTLALPASEAARPPVLAGAELELVLAPVAEKERETEPPADALGPVESAEQATRLAPSVAIVASVERRDGIGGAPEVMDVMLRLPLGKAEPVPLHVTRYQTLNPFDAIHLREGVARRARPLPHRFVSRCIVAIQRRAPSGIEECAHAEGASPLGLAPWSASIAIVSSAI